MGFRKTAHAKIFVDEGIPSFLTARSAAPQVVPPSPAPAKAEPVAAAEKKPAPVPPSEDRRNRPLEMQPLFLVKAVLTAICINGLLYVAFHTSFPDLNLFSLSSTQAPAQTQPAPESSTLEQRVITYSNPSDPSPAAND